MAFQSVESTQPSFFTVPGVSFACASSGEASSGAARRTRRNRRMSVDPLFGDRVGLRDETEGEEAAAVAKDDIGQGAGFCALLDLQAGILHDLRRDPGSDDGGAFVGPGRDDVGNRGEGFFVRYLGDGCGIARAADGKEGGEDKKRSEGAGADGNPARRAMV